ncbi:hypothetical protein MMC25_007720 [Agyrium rufum]|nr:hypothetical protein [Agyrium rufum]
MLRRGGVNASTSIELEYTSLPPQLVAGRALRARHFLLASVCSVALLANVLAVSLSSLFESGTVPIKRVANYTTSIMPIIEDAVLNSSVGRPDIIGQTGLIDHYYMIQANLTQHAALTTWTTQQLYFAPFTDILPIATENTRYSAITSEFGITSLYVPVSSSHGVSDIEALISSNGTVLTFSARSNATNPSTAACIAAWLTENTVGIPSSSAFPRLYAKEILGTSGNCEESFIAGWYRAEITATPSIIPASFEFDVLSCTPTFRSSRFLTTVNSAGQIVDAKQLTPFLTSTATFPNDTLGIFTSNTSLSDLISTSNYLVTNTGRDTGDDWHSSIVSRNYMNFLLRTIYDPRFTDPFASLSTFAPSEVIPVIEKLHVELFAIILAQY